MARIICALLIVALHSMISTWGYAFWHRLFIVCSRLAMVLMRYKEPHQRLLAAGDCRKSRGHPPERCQWKDWVDRYRHIAPASPDRPAASGPMVAATARLSGQQAASRPGGPALTCA